ncbi:unnamed protein product [Acanthoscelides obtectus]|uniref:Acyl-CoA synthetase family member 3, mitochondrial n=1 Tax=Acanthoscelides obtectus TaxID=200917 RepID=A0A9P0JXS9_ACAOB|nr:unnamed protein product [Acanthoscelides obtectus]CAK1631473.1 Acyl-CoA synthetase family member 3, mitochondrial [Acanthoscelides obtectus]
MSLMKKYARPCVLLLKRHLQQTQAEVQPPVSLPTGPVFRNAPYFPDRIAIRDQFAGYTYSNIFMVANELSQEITKLVQGRTNERVMFLCPNDLNYVVTLWAIWLSGQIAVPLSPLHPKNVLLYYANDTNAKLIITTSEYSDLMHKVSKNSHSVVHLLDNELKSKCVDKVATTRSDLEGGLPSQFYDGSNAMILYTSGTTGAPKGVVLSHRNLQFQVTTLLEAWKWSQNDVLLHTLPLHHVHGIVNALLCPLYIGAKTIMLEKFNANTVWSQLLGVNALPSDRKVTVYMAVPTIYSKLIDEYKKVFKGDPQMVEHIRSTLKNKVRLMVSGSAPLPVTIFEEWENISGHRLLERYGMTEIGMALSNLYEGNRQPGYVGLPLPGVSVRLLEENEATEDKENILECVNTGGLIDFPHKVYKSENHKGELLIKSDGVFKEYFNRPEATRKEFTEDGWFKTGDMCEFSSEAKLFKMLGRKSVDIIKSGGYKLSALEIETQLLTHPDIADCSVVGVEDVEWGQKVAAVIVLHEGKEMTLATLKEWAEQKMPKYAVPTMLCIVNELPKNAMGKVNKKELVKVMF